MPPDDTTSHPSSTRPRASSTTPVLSETLINARFKVTPPVSSQQPNFAVVEPGDTEETLHERIKDVERRLFPAAIKAYLEEMKLTDQA